MRSVTVVMLLSVTVGVLAEPQPGNGYQSSGFNCYSGGYGSSIPVLNSHLQTSIVNNPTISFPSIIPQSSASEACHCLQTLVRPQLRNDIITVPTADRITHTVVTPVVKTIDCGGSTRLTTFGIPNNVQSRTVSASEGGRGSGQSSTGTNAYFSGGTTGHSSNSLGASTANRATATLIATPTSVLTFQAPVGGSARDYQNVFSGNTGRFNTF